MISEGMTDNAASAVSATTQADSYWSRIRMLECLADAYMKETGLKASQICLVQESRDNETLFYYKPITDAS